ncbi:TonB-dependent receptor [Winogradskyella ursingii]|uniref:TonB-dependent receptor n=1 Tax=Winogradskyella ursingii TaxID=2686079 RepID=UPI0015C94C0B|nr:TonB-dependent receptor [Winogradskyella ursingii]
MRHIILLLFLALYGYSYGQDCTYTFTGKLIDFHDGTTLSSATIYIKEQDKYMTSDFDGNFKIENLCRGKLTLTISHIACETKTVSYIINSNTTETIALEHHIEELNEVSVTGNIITKETKTAQENLLKVETLKRYSALSLGDALKEVSGVSSINTGNAIVKPMINGLHSSRLLILNNNVRQQDQEWGIEHAPNIDINSADNISVIKGSGALAFGGDAVGGVIIINPKRVILKDTLFGKTIAGGQTNGRGFSLSSSLNKNYANGWFINGQATLKQNGDFESPDYILSNTGSKSKGITLRGGKKTFEKGFELYYSFFDTEIGILRASHIGNIEDLVTAINSDEPSVINNFTYDIDPPKQDVKHHLLKASYYQRFKNFGKLSLQYDYQNNHRFEFDIRVGDDRDKAALDLVLQTHTVMADIILDAKPNYRLKFGALGRYQNNFANPETGVRRLIPDYDKFDFGIYVLNEWPLSSKTVLDAGLRYDFNRIDAKKFYRTSRWEERGYDEDFEDFVIDDLGTQLLTNPVFDYHNFSASAGIKHDLNEKSYVLANYSLSSRPPNPSELFSDGLHHSAARIELGDLRLTKEVANRIAASYSYEGSKFNVLLEGFYNRINDFMFLEPFGVEQTIRGAFPVWNYVQRDAELYGLDLSASYTILDSVDITNKTAYTVGNEIKSGIDLIDIPAFNTRNTITYRNDKWHQFSFALSNEWVFEQNNFPNNNFETTLASSGETVLVDISTPPPAYNLFHLYSDITFDTSENTTLNVALSVNNIFDIEYRAYLNRLRYFADDLGRNIMLQLQFNY